MLRAGLCCLFGISVVFYWISLGLGIRDDRNDALVVLALVELNSTINERIERVVLTDSHVVARIVLCAALANDDVARDALLSTENLDAKSLSC